MKQLALIVILILTVVNFSQSAFAKQAAKKSEWQKKSKKVAKSNLKKKNKKARYKKSKSGLDLVQLTTKSPYEDKIETPENGINKIENEPGL